MSQPVTSLYAHIPFCPAKCAYCAFVTHVGSLKLLEPYLTALAREAEFLAREHPGGPLETVYVGGGTPSMVPADEIGRLLAHLDRVFGLQKGCEITLEAHPGTVDAGCLRAFRLAGVTRVSFGGESLNRRELRGLGRGYSPRLLLLRLDQARAARFQSANVDLMYGIPGQSPASWEETLTRALEAQPDHLSLYPLSIEPGTVFGRRWKENRLELPSDDAVVEMYHLACGRLRASGYEHYEVANWALPGHRCRHNLAYWQNHHYYALGVGAHGYLERRRTENVSQTRRYIERVMGGQSPVAKTIRLDAETELAETVMLRLRLLTDGLSLGEMRAGFGVDLAQVYSTDLAELETAGLIERARNHLWLREEAVPVANEVWQRFVLTSKHLATS
jgi:oxygen-independent coproporphyrinogen-3 oxidase